MAAIEHCQAQDKGFGGVGNTLAMGKVIFFIIVIICLDWNFLFQKWKFL
jgi:hypothetical protein